MRDSTIEFHLARVDKNCGALMGQVMRLNGLVSWLAMTNGLRHHPSCAMIKDAITKKQTNGDASVPPSDPVPCNCAVEAMVKAVQCINGEIEEAQRAVKRVSQLVQG